MPRVFPVVPTLILLLWTVLSAGCTAEDRDDAKRPSVQSAATLTFNGGPRGGTFNSFARMMSALITGKEPGMTVLPRRSEGSLANICELNLDEADMAILYAGDAFLGRHGSLDCEEARQDRVRALAFLYGAPAQLVVRRDVPVRTVYDLRSMTVAVGHERSGAALSAERFFRHLGLWDALDRVNIGYSRAAAEFAAGRVDALWVLAGHPNPAVVEALTSVPARLLDLHGISVATGFYDLYPFYSSTTIPPRTYEGQEEAVATFQDSALWCAREGLGEEHAYRALKAVFSPKGLESMHKGLDAARSMAGENALDNLPVPLHPGAVRFWTEQGAAIPAILLP